MSRVYAPKVEELKIMYAEDLEEEITEYAGNTIPQDEVRRMVRECVGRMNFSFPTMHRNMRNYAINLVDNYRQKVATK